MSHWVWPVSGRTSKTNTRIVASGSRTIDAFRALVERDGGTEPSGQTIFQSSRSLDLGMKPRSTSKQYVN